MGFFEAFYDELIPFCALLLPVVIIWLVLDSSRKKEKERNELVKQILDQGKDPKEILPLVDQKKIEKKEVEKSPAKHFKSGVTMLSIGLGFILTELLSGWGTMGIGAFIGIIGLGELAVAWYLRKYSK